MSCLSLRLFGSFEVKLAEQVVIGFDSDKVRALLAYLAVEARQAHSRAALAGLLWPDSSEQAARRSLSQALFNLRRLLGDQTASQPFLQVTRETVQFNLRSDHRLDVAAFTALLDACYEHAHARWSACAVCAERLAQAVELYRGSFLPHLFLGDSAAFEEWALLQREELQRRALDALDHVTEYHLERGEYESALRHARRQLELDAWREEAHRQVMRALALSGQRSAALAQYEACRKALADELGVEPEPETQALLAQIQRNTLNQARQETRSAARPTLNLPAHLTPFVGRERELAELAQLLTQPDARLITLVGPGGIGKTRLAIQAAANARAAFADGAVFVPLASVESAELIPSSIAQAMSLTFAGTTDAKTQILNHLRDRRLLLVLDNLEHLLAANADHAIGLILQLLDCAPLVTLLVTSRESLNLQGECVFEVQGLLIPTARQINDIEACAAVVLFVQSARRIKHGFTLTADDRPHVAHICQMVEGSPLAIELAAAWIRALTCVEIALEIARGLEFLATSARDVPERHRSLTAVFDHSWQLLSDEEQRTMRQLTVFQGGFTRAAALAIAGASLDVLSALTFKSLLRRSELRRYDLHGLVRHYGREMLRALGEEEAALEAHARYYLTWAEAQPPETGQGEEVARLNRFEQEHDNLRGALAWATTPTGRTRARGEVGLRLAGALWQFWEMRGYHREGLRYLDAVLALSEPSERTLARARALNGAGVLAQEQEDYAAALVYADQAASISMELGDKANMATAERTRGAVAMGRDDLAAARRHLHQALDLSRATGEKAIISHALIALALPALVEGAYGQAEQLLVEGIALLRKVAGRNLLAYSLRMLAMAVLHQGELDRAATFCKESLAVNVEVQSKSGIAACLAFFAGIALTEGDLLRATQLFGAVESVLVATSSQLLPQDRAPNESGIHALRAALDADDFAAAWRRGNTMTEQQAIAFALEPHVGRS